jgi:hypothetical protein
MERGPTGVQVARAVGLGGFWLAAFVVSVSSYTILNDHFDRISRARQIAQYGELPFRDFLDPGYFMTEFTSAGLQLLLGDNLFGEMLLDCVFVASGATLVAALAWRISQSFVSGLTAALLALLTLPRAYDFDKVLFYPLGVAVCWRYVESPTAARIWTLALGVVVAALYRYDTGVYITGAAIVAMAVVHAGNWKALGRRVGLLAAAVVCLSLPVLVFLHYTGGILAAADQMVTYGRRETAGTRISRPPRVSLTNLFSVAHLSPPSRAVVVRWGPSVGDSARRAAEARHGLLEGTLRGEPEERTWAYRIEDSSPSSLRTLLEDPDVEDTSGIERHALRLTPEPLWMRAQRAVPLLRLRLLSGSWHAENANAFLYYLLRALPLVAALALVLKARSPALAARSEVAKVSSLIALCVALNLFILREPVGARVGGMAGPAAILSAWLVHHVWHLRGMARRRILKTVAVVGLVVTAWSVSALADWQHRLTPEIVRPARLAGFVGALLASPPDPDIIGGREFTGMVRYLRECTGPTDRILATWFAPEVYFFAQRGFAAGLVVMFGGHWSEPRFQERSLQSLASHPATIIIHRTGDVSVGQEYRLLAQYLGEHYRNAGTTDFSGGQSGEGSFTVVVRKDHVPTSTHPTTSMPCFS